VTGELSTLTRGSGVLRTVRDSLMDVVLADLERKGEVMKVIPTGLPSLDSLIGGLQPTLIMVLAQAGVGKSAFLATLAHSVAANGHKVGVFSLEDEGDWIAWRLLACEAKVNQFSMRFASLTEAQRDRIEHAGAVVHRYGGNIIVDDRPGLAPQDVVQSAREMVLIHGCEAIILDHLGEMHMSGKRKDRYDLDLDDALRELRDISKVHHIPVVVACHTKRIDPGTPPKLSDAANSASIERKARIALGLSRPADGDKLRIDVLKQTNGVAGKFVSIDFVKSFAVVRDDGTSAVQDAYAEGA
jgi:replicative DNA helicase